jgi:hypothetical protein
LAKFSNNAEMAKKNKRNELLSALRTAEKRVAELRDLLGLPPTGRIVENQSALADFFGVSVRTVDAWRRAAPIALPGKRGQYDLKACFEWWLTHGPGRRGKGRPPGDAIVAEEPESAERLRLARAKEAELRLAEKEGKVISVELFQRMVDAAFIPLRRFAEEQIKEHGNGTADAWTDAVEEFTEEIESVIGKTNHNDGD